MAGAELRKTGIPVIGDVPWGTHFCQFYKTKGDLLDILVPYFKAGLENHEFCIWVTSEPLTQTEAREAMRHAIPDFDQYLESGQIEIVPHDQWYLENGVFSLDRVLSGWTRKLQEAMSRGFEGMRVTGNTAWLEKKDWKSFTEYEEQVNSVIGKHQMMALSSYCLDKCGPYEIIEVISNHRFALVRLEGEWRLIESSERKRSEEELRKSRDFLDRVLNGMHEGVLVVDRNFAIVEVNDCFLRQLGVTRKDVIGRPCHAVTHRVDVPCSSLGESCPLREVFATGKPVRLEHTHPNGRGNKIIVEVSAFPLFGEDGSVELMVEILNDITERKRAEEALRESEELHRLVLSNISDAVFMTDHDGNFTYICPNVDVIFGYSLEEVAALGNIAKLLGQGLWDRGELETAGEMANVELEISDKQGSPHALLVNVKAVSVKGGTTLYTCRDITERKKAEEEIRSLAKFPSENPDPIFRVAADGTLLYANGAGQPLLADWNCGIGQLVPERWRRLIKEVFASGSKRRVEEEHAGSVLSFDVVPIREAGYVNLYGRDITERKRAEEALRLSHRFLVIANRHTEMLPLLKEFVGEIRNYTGCAAVGLRLLDEEGNIPYQAYEGFSERFYELESPLSVKSDRCMCINVIKGETDPKLPFYTEGGSFYMNGTTRFLATVSEQEKGQTRNACNAFGYESVALIPIRLGERLLGLIHVADTRENMVPLPMVRMLENAAMELGAAIERLKANEALAAEKERLNVTLLSIADGVSTADTQGRVVLMNKVAENLTGWSQQEAKGEPLGEVFHIINARTRQRCENPAEKVLATGGVVGLADHTVLIARNGTERRVADSGSPIRDAHGNVVGVVLVFRDITERLRMEELILNAQKLESVGILAGGIAHDFNNILTLILGNISLAKAYTSPGDKVFERLTEAEKASLRAKDLTHQLLTFSTGGVPVKKLSSLGGLLRDSTMFALRGSNVTCNFSIPDDLWAAEVDEGQMSQVINNLIINAVQAMPGGGIVEVGAENVVLGVGSALPLPEGKYLRIVLRDHGIGIHPEHLSRVFDPFFTTKQKGSGLGLATSHRIITNHGGYITVESELGRGSTFFIYLPSSGKEPPWKKAPLEKVIVGHGRVLVMDDEEPIRRLAGDILSRYGYEVEFASDGAEAVELYRRALEAGRRFDAVILDLTVPGGMSGKDAANELLKIDPEVKAIVSSGYSNDRIMANFRDYGFCEVVAKPYEIHELCRTVHRVLKPRRK